jgi:hypothetical protein
VTETRPRPQNTVIEYTIRVLVDNDGMAKATFDAYTSDDKRFEPILHHIHNEMQPIMQNILYNEEHRKEIYERYNPSDLLNDPSIDRITPVLPGE